MDEAVESSYHLASQLALLAVARVPRRHQFKEAGTSSILPMLLKVAITSVLITGSSVVLFGTGK